MRPRSRGVWFSLLSSAAATGRVLERLISDDAVVAAAPALTTVCSLLRTPHAGRTYSGTCGNISSAGAPRAMPPRGVGVPGGQLSHFRPRIRLQRAPLCGMLSPRGLIVEISWSFGISIVRARPSAFPAPAGCPHGLSWPCLRLRRLASTTELDPRHPPAPR